jgi:iron complex outermembrane receptor protein
VQASAWLAYRPRERWAGFKAGVGLRYVGDSWDFTLHVRNVADEEYLATCLARGDCFPGERRTVVGRGTFHFR